MGNVDWLGTILGTLVAALLLIWLAPALGWLLLWLTGLSLAWLLVQWGLSRWH